MQKHVYQAADSTAAFDFGPRYSVLKAAGIKAFTDAGKAPLVVRNYVSVLNAWMTWCRRSNNDVIGREMDADFARNTGIWATDMERDGKASRTISDRLELIIPWQKLACSLAGADTLPDSFPEALVEAMDRRGHTAASLAKVSGIGLQAIKDWCSGSRRPTRHVQQFVTSLEESLRLPAGTLAKRLGFVIERFQVTRAAKEFRDAQTSYGKRLRSLNSGKARLNYLRDPHDNIKREWAQLIAYKIDDVRPHSSKNDTWRVKPAHRVGKKYSWSSVFGDGFVPAADAAWKFLSRYLSWLSLDPADGGAGVPAERVRSLAWVVRIDLMEDFIKWVRARSGNVVHSGMTQVLHYCCMLLRKDSGWVWRNQNLAKAMERADLPASLADREVFNPAFGDAWRSECGRAWAEYHRQAEAYKNSKAFGLSRDPEEPIKDILDMSRPMAVLMEMLAKLKRNPPPLNSRKRRAVWLRDILLLSWLIANPLRVHHFSVMTYRSDQTGDLYRTESGVWHYRCLSSDFKNEPGDYDVSLPDFVGEAIEQYLAEGRPLLGGANSGDYVFVSERSGGASPYDATGAELPPQPGMWTSELIAVRVRLITRAMRAGRPGFGPHAFRHIVATDYLKRMPGAFQLVAHLLNDSLQTVLDNYGHVSAQDGLNVHYEAASQEFKRAIGGGTAIGGAGG